MTKKEKHENHDIVEDAKKVAHQAEEKAKEVYEEGKKSVEKLVDKVIDEEKVNGYWSELMKSFQGATAKDWIIFALGLVFFVWALIQLGELVRGAILLLVSIVLMNMFFDRD